MNARSPSLDTRTKRHRASASSQEYNQFASKNLHFTVADEVTHDQQKNFGINVLQAIFVVLDVLPEAKGKSPFGNRIQTC